MDKCLRPARWFVPILAAWAAACSDHAAPPFEHTTVAHSEIQGGIADVDDTGVVLIQAELGGGTFAVCTGSLIARNVVLTARHCVASTSQSAIDCTTAQFGSPYPAASFRVFNDRTPNATSFPYTVREVVVSPGKALCGNDIALLVLGQSFHPSTAKLIEPRFSHAPSKAEPYSAVGYGKTCPGCSDGGKSRNRLDGLIASCLGAECDWPDLEQNITDKEWAGDDGVCSGDSGGPALDSQGRVIGIASRAAEDEGNCVMSLYERVDVWEDLIRQTTLEAAEAAGLAPPAWAGSPEAGAGGAPSCDACRSQAVVPGDVCSSEWAACAGASDCADLLDCLAECTSDGCRQKCSEAHPSGAQTYQSMLDCACTKACSASCDSTCSGSSAGSAGASGADGGTEAGSPGQGGIDSQLSGYTRPESSGCSSSPGSARDSAAWLIGVAALIGSRRLRRRRE